MRVKPHFKFLKTLKKSSQKKKLIKRATNGEIKSICEICDNCLKGNLPHKKLIKHKASIRYLANKKKTISQKRKYISQKGGFLGSLLSVAIPVIAGLIHGSN